MLTGFWDVRHDSTFVGCLGLGCWVLVILGSQERFPQPNPIETALWALRDRKHWNRYLGDYLVFEFFIN